MVNGFCTHCQHLHVDQRKALSIPSGLSHWGLVDNIHLLRTPSAPHTSQPKLCGISIDLDIHTGDKSIQVSPTGKLQHFFRSGEITMHHYLTQLQRCFIHICLLIYVTATYARLLLEFLNGLQMGIINIKWES